MKSILLAALTVIATTSALSAGPAWPGPCAGDAQKYCADKKSKSLCLIDHESELTPACAEMIAGWSKKTAKSPSSWLGDCSADAERLCAGQRSISRCLIDHEKDLTPGCNKMVENWSKSASGTTTTSSSSWLAVCSKDAEKVCPGKHSISLCMAEHKAELSPECSKFMDTPQPKSQEKKK